MNKSIIVLIFCASVVSAIHSSSSAISCNVGDSENSKPVPGFSECITVLDFASNTVSVFGRHHAHQMPFSDRQVPGLVTARDRECYIKKHSSGTKMVCRCQSDNCNFPIRPQELIEGAFRSL